MLVEYFEESAARDGEHRTVLHMRKFASSYLTGFPGAKRLRDRLQHLDTRQAFYDVIDAVFADGAPEPLTPDHERLRRATEGAPPG